jgi:hypothetical protein
MMQNGLQQLADGCVYMSDQLGLLRVLPGSQVRLNDVAQLGVEVSEVGSTSRRLASLRQSVEQKSGAQMVLFSPSADFFPLAGVGRGSSPVALLPSD